MRDKVKQCFVCRRNKMNVSRVLAGGKFVDACPECREELKITRACLRLGNAEAETRRQGKGPTWQKKVYGGFK